MKHRLLSDIDEVLNSAEVAGSKNPSEIINKLTEQVVDIEQEIKTLGPQEKYRVNLNAMSRKIKEFLAKRQNLISQIKEAKLSAEEDGSPNTVKNRGKYYRAKSLGAVCTYVLEDLLTDCREIGVVYDES